MRARTVAGCLACLLFFATAVSAGWFGPSPDDMAAVCQRYFKTTTPTLDNFLDLDLAILENDADAKLLYKALEKLLDKERAGLDAKLVALEAKGRDVERCFAALYGKEIRDALWHQTRPAKQDAYRKARSEYEALLEACRKQTDSVRRGETICSVLHRIYRRFKEL